MAAAPPSPVDVSVIVPAYKAQATLGRCVSSLLAQEAQASYEVLVIASADHPRELPKLPPNARLRMHARTPRLAAAVARNLGAQLAGGDVLVFVDADVIAPRGWLKRLLDTAATEPSRCVVGSVANGTPSSSTGTAEYLVEFYDLTPARPEAPEHGATCNLLMPRALWDAYGPFPEDLGGCEDTLLTTKLCAAGALRFAPSAYVYHLNRRRLWTVLAHQFALGGAHARLAARQGHHVVSPGRDAAARTLGRVRYLYRRLREWTPSELPRALAISPLVLVTFCAWGLGLGTESARLSKSDA